MRIDDVHILNIRSEVLELLKNMEIGDVLKGRVLEVLANNISVKTASGQVFTAILQEGGSIPKGELVELLINNIADGKIYAELKTESKAANMDTKVADLLKQLGLPVDEKNMEATKLLIKYKLPLDKESVTRITGLQKSIENLSQSGENKSGLLLSGLDIKNTPVDALNKILIVQSKGETEDIQKVLTGLGVESREEVKQLAAKVENLLTSIRNTDMEALTYLVSKEMKITPGNLSMLLKNIENSDGISQFLDKLQERTEGKKSPELMEIKELIRRVFLEPRQLTEGKDVSEQLKDIAKLGEKLESYLNKSGEKDPEIRDALTNLKDSIDFIRNINQHSNYLQIPLIINGDTSTAKLYVFKEGKRSKQINPEDATIVLALDLINLGHLESMIKVKGKSVNLTFRVENKNIETVIKKNGNSLRESLSEKGYSLSPLRIISMEQPFSLLSLEAMINESTADKIHFDMRV